MTFAQRRNRLKTHFSECIPVVKRSMTVNIWSHISYCIIINYGTRGNTEVGPTDLVRLYWNCICFIHRSSNNPFSPCSIIKTPVGAWSKVPCLLNLRTKFREEVRVQLRDAAALSQKNQLPMPTASGTGWAVDTAIKLGRKFLVPAGCAIHSHVTDWATVAYFFQRAATVSE
jgi:hypothetical protein